jgi:hypothetical protein
MRQIAPALFTFAQFWFGDSTYPSRMENPSEAHSYPEMLTHHQIIKRFRKLFGRDMTSKERDIFFLPDFLPDATPAEEEKTSPFLDLVRD